MTLYFLSFEQVFSWITFFYIEKKQYWNFYKSEVSWAYTCLSCIKSVCMEVSFYSEEIFFPLVYIYIPMVCLVVCFTTTEIGFILKNACCMYYWKFQVPYFLNKIEGDIFLRAWSAWKQVSFTSFMVWLWAIEIGSDWDGPVLVWTNHFAPGFAFQKPRFWKLMCTL